MTEQKDDNLEVIEEHGLKRPRNMYGKTAMEIINNFNYFRQIPSFDSKELVAFMTARGGYQLNGELGQVHKDKLLNKIYYSRLGFVQDEPSKAAMTANITLKVDKAVKNSHNWLTDKVKTLIESAKKEGIVVSIGEITSTETTVEKIEKSA